MRELAREQSRKKKKKLFFLLLVIFIIFLSIKIFSPITQIFSLIWDTTTNKEININNKDSINVLVMGIGGGKHDGPNLTDTIIFSNINVKDKKITLVSIPRDLWIPQLNAKINTAYSLGQSRGDGKGLLLSKSVVSGIVGQPIDYAVRIDFNGFIKIVDLLGGLDINIDRSFIDKEYPVSGKENDLCGNKEEDIEKLATISSQQEAFPCRYEVLSFNEGPMHMNGETALKYVRSRHAEGDEGTDFARSKRQEKVIQGIKEKVFSLNTILNPIKVISIIDVLQGSLDTDIKKENYDDFIKLAQKMKEASINSVLLDFGSEKEQREGFLINPPISEKYSGQWVIIPKEGVGRYSSIQKHIKCQINTDC